MTLINSFITSLILCILIIKIPAFNNKIFNDFQISDIQRIHKKPVPRIGGLSIFISFLLLMLHSDIDKLYLLAAIPFFILGILEDLIKHINVLIRLSLITIFSIIIIIYFEIYINNVGIEILDKLLNIKLISGFITLIALVGIINSFNIIDGLNGLCSGIAIIILCAFLYFAILVSDEKLIYIFKILIGSSLGFFIINFFSGRIFLGDGGAYFLGFSVGFFGLYLINNYIIFSKWAILLICFYPIWETLYSIYRRLIIRGLNPGKPDALHLHQILFRRLTPFIYHRKSNLFRNSITSIFGIFLSLINAVIACIFYNNDLFLILVICINIILYNSIYYLAVNFSLRK